jgi:Ca-activated chloride channel family protein
MHIILPRVRRRAVFLLAALLVPSLAARAPEHPIHVGTTVVVGRVTDPAGQPLGGVSVAIDARALRATSTPDGRYMLRVTRQAELERVVVSFRRIGYVPRSLPLAVRGDTVRLDAQLIPATATLGSVVTTLDSTVPTSAGRSPADFATVSPAPVNGQTRNEVQRGLPVGKQLPAARGITTAPAVAMRREDPRWSRHLYPRADSGNTEAYEHIEENAFRSPLVAPLSTFSVDVDRASYANVRRFLSGGNLPPRDAVRIEELVNYFPYADPAPTGRDPLRITTEIAPAPWNPTHDLVRIALRARDVDMRRAPASNLVFLIDVSGSMQGPNRLPLVKQSLALLVNELREQDRVAIVVYAGSAGLVLPSTSGGDKQRILAALEGLQAGGSTAGGAGIRLAYDVARQNFMRGGNNRVILCTDGDFNVGQSSDAELVQLIEAKRREGSFLTILGYGMGNYKDQKMEKLAGAGNGNYAYIDDLLEASKMLVKEMGGTLHTVAKDVKLQVEFDPTRVQAYRLLGYEDRLLRDEDFANDVKDAGDVGAGHAVTALYEIVRAEERLDVSLPGVAPLRYQRPPVIRGRSDELLHVALRYKQPDGERSVLITHPVRAEDRDRVRPSESMRFASAVAGFGMLLRNSPNAGSLTWPQVVTLARGARGDDPEGYRADFIRLTEIAARLDQRMAIHQDPQRDEPQR